MRIPISLNGIFQSERKAYTDINFAVDKPTDAELAANGFVFGRSGTAYYNNSSGNLVAASDGEPAYEHSQAGASLGLRMEPASTNRIVNTALDSDEVATSGKLWTIATSGIALRAQSNITSPDGASNGVSMSGLGQSGAGYHLMYDTTTLASSAAYNGWSASCYAKAGNAKYVGFSFCNNVKIGAAFRLATDGSDAPGIVNSNNCTASMEDVGDGWYRCKMENLQNGAAYMLWAVAPHSTAAKSWNDSAMGSWQTVSAYNSTSGSFPFYTYHANYIYLYGAQFEDSTVCTSYIPNASEATGGVTRNAETLNCTLSDMVKLSPAGNFSKGTFAINGFRTHASSSASPTFLEFSNGSTSDTLGVNADATKEQLAMYDGSGAADIEAGDDVAAGTEVKMACAYRQADYAASLNGANAVTNTTNALPTIDQVHFGKSFNSGRELTGHIKRFRYWNDRRLPNDILKRISAS